MAERDPLTGLYNRRSFDDALARATADGGAAALVLFDFDGFKAVNDDHGHPTGDAVLRAVAEACARVVRDGDCLARIGGDEFALVAPGAAGRRRGADRRGPGRGDRRRPEPRGRPLGARDVRRRRWRRTTRPIPASSSASPTSACWRASASSSASRASPDRRGSGRGGHAVARHHAVVVEPQQLDHVAHVVRRPRCGARPGPACRGTPGGSSPGPARRARPRCPWGRRSARRGRRGGGRSRGGRP